MKPKDYPAIHHSNEYEKAKQPAYRVLAGGLAQKLISGLGKR
jgi:hypothetical protein